MCDSTQTSLEPALCVDLDGTLIRTDLLHELLTRMLLREPWLILMCFYWLLRGGRACLKRRLVERFKLDVSALPYNEELIKFLRQEYSRGRRVVLVSASDEELVNEVAKYLGCFSSVFGSKEHLNLKGENKAELLVAKYSECGFDYAGDSRADLAVWSRAREVIIVGSQTRSLNEKISRPDGARFKATMLFESKRNRPLTILRAMRVQQWIKNILIFVPIVMAHKFLDYQLVLESVRAFLAFSLCASSVYLLNDFYDLESDRRHRIKKFRPLASGHMSLLLGWVLIPLLIILGLSIAWTLPHAFFSILLAYLVITFVYSSFIKKIDAADIVVLAMLYTLRVLAGGYAAAVPVSQWLLGFSMFFFLSLACLKRYSELHVLQQVKEQEVRRRGYQAGDIQQVSQFGCASGYIAVLVLALYVSSAEVSVLYTSPRFIWLICPLVLYWVSRIWLLAARGKVHEDPVLFAVRDKVSYLVGLLAVAILLLAA